MKTLSKGLNKDKVREISILKGEPNWMMEYRLESYDVFDNLKMPSWGQKIDINLDNITYYKKVYDDVSSWDNIEVT